MSNAITRITIQAKDELSVPVGSMQNAVAKINRTLVEMTAIAAKTGNTLLDAFSRSALGVFELVDSLQTLEDNFTSTLAKFGIEIESLVADFNSATNFSLTEILQTTAGISDGFLQGFGINTEAIASVFSRIPEDTRQAVGQAVNQIDGLLVGILDKAEEVPKKLDSFFGGIGDTFGFVSGATEPLAVFNILKDAVGQVSTGIFQITQEIAFFTIAMQGLQQLVTSGPFDMLIGQNIRLQQQLLSTQATLASTSQVIQDGFRIQDPTEAIQALDGVIKQAISNLREDSLELVGVTSASLVPLFQIVAQQITGIGGGMQDAVDLSINFAATLGTLGLPLAQARQEISSILLGTIDMNSVIAKSLGITNKMVETWRTQGTLLENLNKKLGAFRAGNALAAQTIEGIASNIQEIFEEVTRIAGEPLIAPIVVELDKFYKTIQANRAQILDFFSQVSTQVGRIIAAGAALGSTLANSLLKIAQQIPLFLFESLANAFVEIANAVTFTLKAIQPLIDVFASLAKNAIALTGPFLKLFVQFKTFQFATKALAGGFELLLQLIPGVGEVLFLLTGRTSGFIGQFTALRSQLGLGASGFLLLGKNLRVFSGAYNELANSIPILGPALANLVPQIAAVGIGLTALSVKFPIVKEALGALAVGFGRLTPKLAELAGRAGLPLLSEKIKEFGTVQKINGKLTEAFTGQMKNLGVFVLKTTASVALWTGAILAAGFAINEFIIKNETLGIVVEALGGALGQFGELLTLGFTTPAGQATLAVTALSTAIIGSLIPAVRAAIAQLGVFLVGAVSGLGIKLITLGIGLAKFGVLLKTQTILGFSLGLSLRQVGLAVSQLGVQLNVLSLAVQKGTLSFALFKTQAIAVGGALKALAVAAAPLAAGITIAIAVVGFGLLKAATQQLKNAREEFEAYEDTVENLSDRGMDLAQQIARDIETVNEARNSGIAISNDENKAIRLRREEAEREIKALEDEAKTLEKRAEKIHPKYRDALMAEAEELRVVARSLTRLTSKINLNQIELEELGGTYDQLSSRVNAALEALDKPFGDVEVFKRRTKEVIDLTNKQLKLNQITEESAIERFEKIANNTKVEVDLQIQAIEAIASARNKAVERENSLLDAQNEYLRAQADLGLKSSIEVEQQITENKRAQIRARVEAERVVEKELIEREKKAYDEAQTLIAQSGIDRNEAELEAAQNRLNGISNAIRTSQSRLGKLYAEDASAFLDGQRRLLDAQLKQLDRAQKEATDAQAAAEAERLVEIQKLRNDQVKTEIEAEALRTQATRDRIKAELKQEKNRLSTLKRLQAQTNRGDEAKRQADIRASALRVRKLNLDLLQNEFELERKISAQIIESIEDRAAAQKNAFDEAKIALNEQSSAFDDVSKSLERQNILLEAQSQLISDTQGLIEGELNILKETAESEEDKAKIIEAIAKSRLQSLLVEQDLEREKLKIQEQQLMIALRKEESEKRLAKLQNQGEQAEAIANLQAAQADPDSTKAQKEAARIAVQVAQLQGEIIDRQLKLLDEEKNTELKLIDENRKRLELRQQAQRDAANLNVGKSLADDTESKNFLRKLRNEVQRRSSLSESAIKSRLNSSTKTPKNPASEDNILPPDIRDRINPTSQTPEKPVVRVPALQGVIKMPEVAQPAQVKQDFGSLQSSIEASTIQNAKIATMQSQMQNKMLTELRTIAERDPAVVQQTFGALGKKIQRAANRELSLMNL